MQTLQTDHIVVTASDVADLSNHCVGVCVTMYGLYNYERW